VTGRLPVCEESGIAERLAEIQAERMTRIAGCACPQRTTQGEVVHVTDCPLGALGPAAMGSPSQISLVLAAVERLRAKRKHPTLPSADELLAEGHAAIEAARHRVLR